VFLSVPTSFSPMTHRVAQSLITWLGAWHHLSHNHSQNTKKTKGDAGESTSCRTVGADPATGCTSCRTPQFYKTFGAAGSVDISCAPVKAEGLSCSAINQNGEFFNEDVACRSGLCRDKCCGPSVKADAQTLQQCTACDQNGDCAQCHEDGDDPILFALSDDEGTPRCLRGCDASADGRGLVLDGETDTRKRFVIFFLVLLLLLLLLLLGF
jgi:hypothetical protein